MEKKEDLQRRKRNTLRAQRSVNSWTLTQPWRHFRPSCTLRQVLFEEEYLYNRVYNAIRARLETRPTLLFPRNYRKNRWWHLWLYISTRYADLTVKTPKRGKIERSNVVKKCLMFRKIPDRLDRRIDECHNFNIATITRTRTRAKGRR